MFLVCHLLFCLKKTKIGCEFIVKGLDIPWGFSFPPDNSILITEKEGALIHFKNRKMKLVEGMPKVTLRGQGGLLDIALHSNFKENQLIYLM